MVELHGRYLAGGVVMFSGYGGVEFGGCGGCVSFVKVHEGYYGAVGGGIAIW